MNFQAKEVTVWFFFAIVIWPISIIFIHLFLHFHLLVFSILTFFETQNREEGKGRGRDEWGKKVEEGELSSFVLDISFRFQFSSDLCHLLFALKLFFYWSNETRYWFQILSIKFSYFGLNSELHACNWAVMWDGAVNRQNDKQTDQGYNEYVSKQYFHTRISEI